MHGGPTDHEEPGAAVSAAADAVVVDLMHDHVVDLRTGVPPSVRAGGASAGPVTIRGCPCGCGEAELLDLARAGQQQALHELLVRYRTLARAKARSYFLIGAEHEDLVQEGMIGLLKAIKDFDPTLGVPFRGFAEVCVNRQLISAVKAATRHKHKVLSGAVSLDSPVGPAADESRTLAEVVPATAELDPAEVVVSRAEIEAIRRHFSEVLSDLEAQVLRHHVQGKTYDEIAAMLQRHTKSVDNALQRIKRKLQGHLEDRDRVPPR